MQVWYSIIAGFAISLSGSLPFGNLNITAMHIAAREQWRAALWFAFGVAIVEMTYLRITLLAINWITAHRQLFLICQWATVALLIALAVSSFKAANAKSAEGKNVLIDNKMNRLFLGVIMSSINPMQFPFWAGWVTYLLTQHWLYQDALSYNVFTVSAGIGTMLALGLFIFLGEKFSTSMKNNNKIVQTIIGVLFLTFAVIQIVKLIKI
jgi:threonine/homoserine/homoserine lactone efflux protein